MNKVILLLLTFLYAVTVTPIEAEEDIQYTDEDYEDYTAEPTERPCFPGERIPPNLVDENGMIDNKGQYPANIRISDFDPKNRMTDPRTREHIWCYMTDQHITRMKRNGAVSAFLRSLGIAAAAGARVARLARLIGRMTTSAMSKTMRGLLARYAQMSPSQLRTYINRLLSRVSRGWRSSRVREYGRRLAQRRADPNSRSKILDKLPDGSSLIKLMSRARQAVVSASASWVGFSLR